MKPFLIFSIISAITGSAIAIGEQKREVLRSLTESPAYLVEGPLASIVVPTLEEEKYLPNLLTSIQNQTYRSIEVIVADQSRFEIHERTQEICRQYDARCIYVNELSPSIARNKGAELATGDLLIFSDADNVLAPTCIENLVRALDDGYILANPVNCIYDDGLYSFGTLWRNNWLKSSSRTTCCVAIWRDSYFEVGGYDENCDPLTACREDLKLGKSIVERFGRASTKLVRSALVGTSARRLKKQGFFYPTPWKDRAVRHKLLTNYD